MFINSFNKNGDVESVIIEDHKGNIQGKTKYQYDDKQRLICELYYSDRYSSPSEKRYEYYNDNTRHHYNHDMGVITTYDSNGKVMCVVQEPPYFHVTAFNYNCKGELISVTSHTDTASSGGEERILDEDGKILKQMIGYGDGGEDITYIYDSKGILVRKDIIGGGAYEGESYIQYQEYDTHNNPQIIKDTNMSRYKIIEYTYRSR